MHALPRHVVVCWPNCAGSTLAEKLLSTADNVASLPAEGQFIEGFAEVAPIPMRLGAAMLFTEVADVLQDPDAYDWAVIRRLWSRAWDRHGSDRPIRLEKSTPDVCRLPMMARELERLGTVIGWRDPYAQSEGILRARPGLDPGRVAHHVVECLRFQRSNLEWAAANAVPRVAFSYEDLTSNPEEFCQRARAELGIHAFVPPELTVKGQTRPIVDMNVQQVANLTPGQTRTLTETFADAAELLGSFGYELR